MAARQRAKAQVVGYDSSAESMSRATERGALDVAADTLSAAVSDAAAVFIAVPVAALAQILDAVLAGAPADCVITDVGSTKRGVVAACQDSRFVGGHPLAGLEIS